MKKVIKTYFIVENKFNSSSTQVEDSLNQKNYSNVKSESKVIFKEPNSTTQKNFIHWFFLANALLGLCISALIFLKFSKLDINNVYFTIFLTGVSLMLLELALLWWNNVHYNPKVPFFRAQFYFWIPSLFLYMRNKIENRNTINLRENILQYLVPTMMLGSYIYILFFDVRILSQVLSSLTFKAIYTFIYLAFLVRISTKQKNKIPLNIKKWLVFLASFIIVIFLLLSTRAYFESDKNINSLSIYFLAILFSTFITIISFILFFQPEIFIKKENIEKEEKTKYKNSGLTDDMLNSLKIELNEILRVKKVYLDNTLTLEGLAEQLNTDRYSLSQTINQEFDKNYYELINDYRIEEAIRKIHNSESDLVICDLIYETGFNNKVSFYKAFKKRHLKTPLEYQKSIFKDKIIDP
ncbi:AraC family transcriptional regulator [Cellulophaga sp. L1A9]|uniref:helix-turn-helix domain-containing protein n=1 Tax=Cellulophaga sp. L1A9 TaxID=2686362 RepID=UPI00131E4FF4|nr:helix-turn-helix domain-containing protein [Cellulophaga sp. L1A9]